MVTTTVAALIVSGVNSVMFGSTNPCSISSMLFLDDDPL